MRDAAADALASVLKVVGERPLAALLDPLDKLKSDKIRSLAERVVLGPAGAAAPSLAADGAAAGLLDLSYHSSFALIIYFLYLK